MDKESHEYTQRALDDMGEGEEESQDNEESSWKKLIYESYAYNYMLQSTASWEGLLHGTFYYRLTSIKLLSADIDLI